MFDNYESLKCKNCNEEFTGRKPADGGDTICYECTEINIVPIVNKGDIIPDSVDMEITGGKGEDV